jgi:hypothetical protein
MDSQVETLLECLFKDSLIVVVNRYDLFKELLDCLDAYGVELELSV